MSKATNSTQRVTFGKAERFMGAFGPKSSTEVFLDGEEVAWIGKDQHGDYELIIPGMARQHFVSPIVGERQVTDWRAGRDAAKAAAIAHFTPTEENAPAETVEVEEPAQATNNTQRVTFGKPEGTNGWETTRAILLDGHIVGVLSKGCLGVGFHVQFHMAAEGKSYSKHFDMGHDGIRTEHWSVSFGKAKAYVIEMLAKAEIVRTHERASGEGVTGFLEITETTEEPAQAETVEAHVVVTNDEGRAFSVVVVLEGERYGLNDCLTHDKADPLVEFYDMTGDDRAFTGGRYYLSTLAGEDQWALQPGEGLDLNGGVRDWSVSWENVCEAVAYARKREAHA